MRWTLLLLTGCAARLHLPDTSDGGDGRIDAGDLVLNEVLVDPSTTADPGCDGVPSVTSDEFVGLVNTSAGDVDLSGGTVSDAILVRHVFPDGTVLRPGGALLVFGGGDPQPCTGGSGVLIQTAGRGALGLSNSGDRVLIVVDGVTVADHTIGGEGDDDQSLVRSPELSDGPFVQHQTVSAAPSSPGTLADGTPFDGLSEPPDPPESAATSGCDDANLADATDGLSGDDLVEALHAFTSGHSCDGYTATTDFLFGTLDGGDGDVACVYTGRTTEVNGGRPDNDDMNTEHSWPQSLGADTNPMRCDLHHLYPSDSGVNSVRGNHPFGVVVTDTDEVDGGSRVGLDADGRLVFEPRNVQKGNTARSMLYFAMRYDRALTDAERGLYAEWSAFDPPDAAERDRTGRIADRQGAENPYVVCAELADR